MDNALSAWLTVLSSPFSKGGVRGISSQNQLQNLPCPLFGNCVTMHFLSLRASEARTGIQYFKLIAEPLYLTKCINLKVMTLPEKPNSRLQKYRPSKKGKKPHREFGEGGEVR